MSEWENVASAGSSTYRMNVEGGWVYRYGEAICFVPVPSPAVRIPKAILPYAPRELEQCEVIDVESKDVPDHMVNGSKVDILKEKI